MPQVTLSLVPSRVLIGGTGALGPTTSPAAGTEGASLPPERVIRATALSSRLPPTRARMKGHRDQTLAEAAVLFPIVESGGGPVRHWSPLRWGVALASTLVAALSFGVPTGVVPSRFYTRMTPVLWWNYPSMGRVRRSGRPDTCDLRGPTRAGPARKWSNNDERGSSVRSRGWLPNLQQARRRSAGRLGRLDYLGASTTVVGGGEPRPLGFCIVQKAESGEELPTGPLMVPVRPNPRRIRYLAPRRFGAASIWSWPRC